MPGPVPDKLAASRGARMDDFQRRHAWLGIPVAVIYKFVDDQGNYLSVLITYYGFLSLFPLLLLAVSVLGFTLHGNPKLQQEVITSALSELPVIGKQIQTDIHGYTGSGVALVVGILGSLYGGLGVAQAGQNAMNVAWGVPRNSRPNPIRARFRSLVILVFLGGGVLATSALSIFVTGARDWTAHLSFGILGQFLAVGLSLVLNVVLFVVAFRILTVRPVTIRDVIVGAVVAGVAWQILQDVGGYYVAHKLKGAREIYGVFAIVLGLIAVIYIEALILVVCAELNVVLGQRLWPRALFTPFTDNVQLTDADRAAYGSYARSQRFKGYQNIDVDFDKSPDRPAIRPAARPPVRPPVPADPDP